MRRCIPEGAGRCQGSAGLQFRARALGAGHSELASWLAFPRAGADPVRAGGWAKDRVGEPGIVVAAVPWARHGAGDPTRFSGDQVACRSRPKRASLYTSAIALLGGRAR